MARVFSTSFTHQGQSYPVVVSITEANGITAVNIYLPDTSLHEILPGGKFSFNAKDGLLLNYPKFTPAQDLLISVLSAVDDYHHKNQYPPKLKHQ